MILYHRAFARIAATWLPMAALGLPCAADAQEAPVAAGEKSRSDGERGEPDDDHGDIVVLGTRSGRDGTLGSDLITRRMSQSSRSLERDLLVANGTYRLSDALELFSGISQQNNRGGFQDNFAIRGFLGTPDGGAESYVDGFLANRGQAPPRDPATIERIEVLKGPSGAVFGDIDPAGRVNVVSKTPRFVAHAQATLLYGSFDTRRGELDVTGPLTTTLAGRIVVAAEDGDGFRDFVGLKRRTVSPSLTWRPRAGTRITALVEHTGFDSPFDRGMPAVDGDALALPPGRFVGEPSNGDTRARNTRLQLTGEHVLSGEWSLNGGAVWRHGSLRGFSSDQSRLMDGRTLWRQRRERGFEVTDVSARLELAGRFDALGVHHPSLGMKGYTLDYLELLRRRNPSAGYPYAIDVFDPVYGAAVAQPLLPSIDQRERRRVATLYAQDMWDVTGRLTLTGGVRFDAYRQRLRRNLTATASAATGEPVGFRAGARWRVTDTVAVHANWGESFLLNSGTGRDGEAFGPERATGHELGVAGRWAGVNVAATFFDIEKRGILTNDPIDPNYNAPVGALTSRGVELDASVDLGRRWKVVANYAYIDARSDDATFLTTDVLNVATHSGTLLIVARYPTRWGTEWSISGGATHVGDRAGAIDASALRLPAYTKVKLAGEIGVTPDLTLRIEADNLLDERYAMSSYSPVWMAPALQVAI